MTHFCLPNVLVWYPEAQYPDWYPEALPCCKWHGDTKCVVREGWMRDARHGYASHRITAIMGRYYECTIRRDKTKEKPFSFRSIDPAVIKNSDDYIKEQWNKMGLDMSHRAAIEIDLLEHLRSDLIQGLGINPFRRSHIEMTKRYHFRLSRQNRAYVDMLRSKIRRGASILLTPTMVKSRMEEDFAEFDSDMYHQQTPSNSYLIGRVIQFMEADAEYRTRRMQMIDGRHLSGDHSFKLVKTVIAGGVKAFAAMYCIMNKFGQVAAWWFTTGTGMKELEQSVIKLRRRYDQLGYDEPESFTTDRCCNERNFWKGALKLLDNYVDLENVNEEDTRLVAEVDMCRHEFSKWMIC